MSTVTIPDFSERSAAPESRWNFAALFALLSLVLIWAVKLHSTWAAWGNLTIDPGHEIYVLLLRNRQPQLQLLPSLHSTQRNAAQIVHDPIRPGLS